MHTYFFPPALMDLDYNSHSSALPIVLCKDMPWDRLQEEGIMGGEWQMEQGDRCALWWLDSDCVLAAPGLLYFHFAAPGHGARPAGAERGKGGILTQASCRLCGNIQECLFVRHSSESHAWRFSHPGHAIFRCYTKESRLACSCALPICILMTDFYENWQYIC